MKQILMLVILSCSIQVNANDITEREHAIAEVRAFAYDWMVVRPKWIKKITNEKIEAVVDAANEYRLDPLLVAVFVSLESSWDEHSVGEAGEKGLMQVHTVYARRGFDLQDSTQQIQAGARWLRKCIDTCKGNLRQGVNMYTAGTCTAPWVGLQKRMQLYRTAVKTYRLKDRQ